MIIDFCVGDILAVEVSKTRVTGLENIAFAINTEGINDAGFAGLVARKFWPEIAFCGENNFGVVLSKKCDDRQFHAIVCHSLKENGWQGSPGYIAKALSDIKAKRIACVLMGAGPVGRMQNAPVGGILGALARAEQEIIVYTKDSL